MKQVNYQQKNNYSTYQVKTAQPLLEWLLQNLEGASRNKIKATLHGHGIKVNGKIRTQFNWPLQVGDKISVSKSKQNDCFRSRYLRLVYEDKYIVVIEKNIGILSMEVERKSCLG